MLRFSKNWGNNLIGEDMCAYIYAVTREIEHVLFNLILMKVCANMIKAFFFLLGNISERVEVTSILHILIFRMQFCLGIF